MSGVVNRYSLAHLFPARRHTVGMLVLLASAILTPLMAQEQSVNPGINRYYYDAQFERWRKVFERKDREVYDRRHDIVAALALKTGMFVADVGAGTGFFSLMFAEAVGPTGKVYAVDISENFVNNILRRARKQGLENIVGIVSTQKDPLLPPGSVNVVFLCDTYHHFEYPQTMLASIHEALRPRGQLIVIDFRKQHGASSDWVMSHVRANETIVQKEIEGSGFTLISRSDLLRSNYFLRFTKTTGPR
jgi:ubiquinone/menaquinone biosynthesis C-methylase UbiE